jgi:hypothetical protein
MRALQLPQPIRVTRPVVTIVESLQLFLAIRERERRELERGAIVRFLQALRIDHKKIEAFFIRASRRKR